MQTGPKHYDNPPLVEAIFEFFSADAKARETSELVPLFQAEFPEFSQPPNYLEMELFEFQLDPNNPARISQEKIQPRCRLITPQSETNNLMIQFNYGMCALNVLKPYSHYEPDYLPILQKLFNLYAKESITTKLKLIGQRYINYIVLPEDGQPATYFKFYPTFSPEFIGKKPPRFSMQVEHSYLSNGTLLLSLNQDLNAPEGQLAFYLDIYARCDEELSVDWNTVKSWHDEAHRAIKQGFEHAITDETRTLFKNSQHSTDKERV